MFGPVAPALTPVATPLADRVLDNQGYWTSIELLLRVGLPVLLIAVGAGVVLWGRREQVEAQHRIRLRTSPEGPLVPTGSTGGDRNGPRSVHAIDREQNVREVDVEEGEPDPQAGRAKIAGGTAAVVVGILVLTVITAVRVFAG